MHQHNSRLKVAGRRSSTSIRRYGSDPIPGDDFVSSIQVWLQNQSNVGVGQKRKTKNAMRRNYDESNRRARYTLLAAGCMQAGGCRAAAPKQQSSLQLRAPQSNSTWLQAEVPTRLKRRRHPLLGRRLKTIATAVRHRRGQTRQQPGQVKVQNTKYKEQGGLRPGELMHAADSVYARSGRQM